MFSVYVCFGDPCAQILIWETILRGYCVDWIIGWVVCWIAFMSVFFSSWKNCFEKLARHLLDTLLSVELLKPFLIAIPTPPRYLLDTLLSVEFLKPFSYRNPNSSLIPGGSIELLFLDLILCFSILARYLSYQWPFSRHLPRQLPRHLICRDLLRVYIFPLRDPFLISSISLDLFVPVHLPNTLSFTPNLFLEIFQASFKFFSLLVSF